jgi:hypothetical protein
LQKPPDWNPKLWSQPLFLGAMICVGMYQFYNVRHRGGGGMGKPRSLPNPFRTRAVQPTPALAGTRYHYEPRSSRRSRPCR